MTDIKSNAVDSKDVLQAVERLRKRLLDLTNRNPLLNYRIESARAGLRVVDEVPDLLFSKLIDGEALSFASVPYPEKKALLGEPEQKDLEEWLLKPPDKSAPSKSDAEDDEVRPSAVEHARKVGIATSYDLQTISGASAPPKHTDNLIQTLLYQEDLDASLRKIASKANTTIEETGSNSLYLIFGFLEWYESPESKEPRFAPLMAMPITIERRRPKDAGSYQYYISHPGEEIAPNTCLAEKLRHDFGLSLPVEMDAHRADGEDAASLTPEEYLLAVTEAVKTQPRWRVRRQVRMTLLSFAKLQMYYDLDDTRWEPPGSLSSHPLVQQIIASSGKQDDGTRLAEHDMDSADPEKHKKHESLLYFDADSSQHSAVIDALDGKNIVVEGPPGTGKSQTIANIIAAALAERKSVLFVSEKLAALEVVRRRLDDAGLGVFCLELHSHKTQKKGLVGELEQRLEKRRTFGDPKGLDDKIDDHKRARQKLHEYVKVLGSSFGSWTVQQILGNKTALRQEADALKLSNVPPPDVPDAKSISPGRLEELLECMGSYVGALEHVLSGRVSCSEHPWQPLVSVALLGPDEQARAVRLVETLHIAAERCDTLIADLLALMESPGTSLRQKDVPHLLEEAAKVPAPPAQADLPWATFPALAEPAARRDLGAFADKVGALQRRKARMREWFPKLDGVDRAALQDLLPKVLATVEHVPPGTTVDGLRKIAGLIDERAKRVSGDAGLVCELARAMGLADGLTMDDLPALQEVAQLIQAAPDALSACTARIDFLNRRATCVAIAARAGKIVRQQQAVAARALLSELPDAASLNEAAAWLRRPAWLGWVTPGWWKARSMLRRLSRMRDGDLESGADLLSDLAEYEEALSAFFTAEVSSVFPAMSNAGPGAISMIIEIAAWVDRACSLALRPASPNQAIRRMLQDGAISRVVEMREIAKNAGPPIAELVVESPVPRSPIVSAYSVLRLPPSTRLVDLSSVYAQTSHSWVVRSSRLISAGVAPTMELANIAGAFQELTKSDAAAMSVEADQRVKQLLGSAFHGQDTDAAATRSMVDLAGAIAATRFGEDQKRWLMATDYPSRHLRFKKCLEQLRGAWEELEDKKKNCIDFLSPRVPLLYRTGDATVTDIVRKCSRAIEARAQLGAWAAFVQRKNALSALLAPRADGGLDRLVQDVESGKFPAKALTVLYQLGYFLSLSTALRKERADVDEVLELAMDDKRAAYAQLDVEFLKLQRLRAAHRVDARADLAPPGTGVKVKDYSEMKLVNHVVRKKNAHVTIRSLVERSPQALVALKPCFMMGPLAVAQYLKRGAFKFDMVVMDEASQLRPEDALGAIARGKQVVVVGDPKQLPPTSFFEKISAPEDDDDATGVEEAESILDAALTAFDVRRLLWHYRSRHQSLIAFSNHHFYGDSLIVFPSPRRDVADLGVKLLRVPGEYEASKNLIEAQAVADLIVEHFKHSPSESLGVVALNVVQRDLIDDILEARLRSEPMVADVIREKTGGPEPFFIKNLENVQGDERDVIIISVTYGPDKNGNVFQRFGPLTGASGGRRLNVLFTRAKRRITVVSSMDSRSIQGDRRSGGAQILKRYLEYAETGVLIQAKRTGREPDSDFERMVANTLRENGYDVEPQVGVCGYFVDIGVLSPVDKGRFILAVECDGATYHSGKSVRDRDRLRQRIIEDMGWRVHRIWSTDWFKNYEVEKERLLKAVKQASDADKQAPRPMPISARPTWENGVAYPRPQEQFAAEIGTVRTDSNDQKMLESAVRVALVRFRDKLVAGGFPPDDPQSILRDEMLHALAVHRPRDTAEFQSRISPALRQAVAAGQAKLFLQEILATIRGIVDLGPGRPSNVGDEGHPAAGSQPSAFPGKEAPVNQGSLVDRAPVPSEGRGESMAAIVGRTMYWSRRQAMVRVMRLSGQATVEVQMPDGRLEIVRADMLSQPEK
jgi:very-short-patch-repair endonuclease